MENKLVVFKGKEIRRTLYKNEWWFSVGDVVAALTDSVNVTNYIKKMRKRDTELNSYWSTNCTPLELIASDGKSARRTAPTPKVFSVSSSYPLAKAENRKA